MEVADYYNSTANSTFNMSEPWGNITRYGEYSTIRSVIIGTVCVATMATIVLNVSLVILILSRKNFRSRPFYWHILGLCFAHLVEGVLVTPFTISYARNFIWSHGEVFCKIWSVLEMTAFTLSTTVLVSLCIDRLEAKLRTLGRVGDFRAKVLPVLLVLFPWVYFSCICVPMIIAGGRNFYFDLDPMSCFFDLEHEFYLPVFIMTHAVPGGLLLITTIVMIVVYRVKREDWYRLTENDKSDDLRSSTKATLVVCVVTLVLSLPYVLVITMHVVSYILYVLTSSITPLLWLVCTEIRHAYRDSILRVLHGFGLCLKWRPPKDSDSVVRLQDCEGGDKIKY